jgi:hypothetical protein
MTAPGFTVTDPRQLEDAVAPMTQQVANDISAQAAINSPRRTGRLAASWRVEAGDGVSWRVETDVPYAPYVEYGSEHNPVPAAMLGRAVEAARRSYG